MEIVFEDDGANWRWYDTRKNIFDRVTVVADDADWLSVIMMLFMDGAVYPLWMQHLVSQMETEILAEGHENDCQRESGPIGDLFLLKRINLVHIFPVKWCHAH